MYTRKNIFLLLLAIPASLMLVAQAPGFFSQRGNNFSDISCGGILYAPIQNKYHQAFGAGAAWVKTEIDLRQPFSINFVLDYTDTIGVDGGAFVLQADTNAVGEAYNGLGYRKVDKSIAITFDPVSNNYDADPPYDHISIQANGDLNHSFANNLAGPVSLAPFCTTTPYNPPDSDVVAFHHLINISWDPSIKKLSASIEGAEVIAYTGDIVQQFFAGNPMVHWGFTASNTQPVAYPPQAEVTFGYMYFFFGDVFPRYGTDPVLDTCYGRPIQFSDSSLYFSDYSLLDLQLFKWYWSFGDGTFSTDRNPPLHSYPGPGICELKFTATNQLGCTTDTLQRIIRLGSIPKPDFSTDALCTNSATLFSDQTKVDTGIPVAWQWDFDNSTTSTDKNPIMSFTTAGVKTIKLAVSTEFGCKADTTKTILITDKPNADFSYIKNCEGLVNYTSVISNNVIINNLVWDFGDGHSSNTANPSHHFLQNNTFSSKLVAVSESGCVSDTIRKDIVINKVYPFAGNDTIIAIGQPLQLEGSGGSEFYWNPSTGLDNPFIENPIAVLSHDQVYSLLVKNEDGCEGRDTVRIKVYKGPELYVPTAFTPDGNGLNDIFRITAPGLKQLDYLRVFDRWGKLVFQSQTVSKGWDGMVNSIAQPSGTYVWIIKGVDYKNNVLFRKGTVTLIR